MGNKFLMWLGAFLTGAAAIGWAFFGKARAERKLAKQEKQQYKDIAVENAKEIERVKQAEKVRNDVSRTSNDDVTNELLKYARDRDKD
ncbi:hypothetical protein VPKG_00014 [Vibrio phage pYD21-A]|uniref:hypothetical protein n=1 Tax=Vibrio phage pYD21-A TaxID=754049 RepID=UPI0002C14A09|nr:hypothetical protein VPKG_00014 [Vibrio phage pYD21-A]AGH16051.1 hypothetical protein VPKG_00014 [Vibrio phage pYD21-A]